MIVTVTTAPSSEHEVRLGRMPGDATPLAPGGRGTAVARTLAANGIQVRAVLPVRGRAGHRLASALADGGVEVLALPTFGTAAGGDQPWQLTGSPPEPRSPGDDQTAARSETVADTVVSASRDAQWVVLWAESQPPADLLATLVRRISAAGVAVAVATRGPALRRVLAERPALVVLDRPGLAAATDCPLWTLEDVVAAAGQLRGQGTSAVLTSLGGAGAVLVDGAGAWHARSASQSRWPAGRHKDALLAGFLAVGEPGALALLVGTAWAAAAATVPPGTVPGPRDIHPWMVTVDDVQGLSRFAPPRLSGRST